MIYVSAAFSYFDFGAGNSRGRMCILEQLSSWDAYQMRVYNGLDKMTCKCTIWYDIPGSVPSAQSLLLDAMFSVSFFF